MLLLHIVEYASRRCKSVKYFLYVAELNHTLGNHLLNVSDRNLPLLNLGIVLREFSQHIDTSLCELANLCCSQIVRGFHLSESKNDALHVDPEASGHIGKAFCSIVQLAALHLICSQLLGVFGQLANSERRLGRKFGHSLEEHIGFVLVLEDSAKCHVLEFKLTAHLYQFVYIALNRLYRENAHQHILQLADAANEAFLGALHSAHTLFYGLLLEQKFLIFSSKRVQIFLVILVCYIERLYGRFKVLYGCCPLLVSICSPCRFYCTLDGLVICFSLLLCYLPRSLNLLFLGPKNSILVLSDGGVMGLDILHLSADLLLSLKYFIIIVRLRIISAGIIALFFSLSSRVLHALQFSLQFRVGLLLPLNIGLHLSIVVAHPLEFRLAALGCERSTIKG